MQPQSLFQRLALRFTKWVGSSASIVVHTIFFVLCFVMVLFGIDLDKVLLILTTVVSLEAIYLAIFIQIAINNQTQSIQEVEKDIDEIQGDIDEIQVDVDEIQEDVDEIQEDVEDATSLTSVDDITLNTIYADLKKLVDDVEKYKHQEKDHNKTI
ncbi:DUF1003 domain-containing protein [Patescibacteria group bacterium]|nr:DUF1003 domain-containing protein [Patescibacteria group bacterium]